MIRGLPAIAVLGAISLTCVGCGGASKVPVQGTVKYKGVPIKKGTISFQTKDSTELPVEQTIIDGQYSFEGDHAVTVGEKLVRISGLMKSGRKVKIGGTAVDAPKNFIPIKYNGKTKLSVTITPGGTNTHDFDLPP